MNTTRIRERRMKLIIEKYPVISLKCSVIVIKMVKVVGIAVVVAAKKVEIVKMERATVIVYSKIEYSDK